MDQIFGAYCIKKRIKEVETSKGKAGESIVYQRKSIEEE